jgi:hypothetical protein
VPFKGFGNDAISFAYESRSFAFNQPRMLSRADA